MGNVEYAYKDLFWLMAILPVLALTTILWINRRQSKFGFSSFRLLPSSVSSFKSYYRYLSLTIQLGAMAMIIMALARPQSSTTWQNVETEGIDIIVALDISGSMLAEDLKPNRLEASKNVALDFISERNNDRIGLVIYSGESFTQCPLTSDHSVLKNLFADIQNGMIEDGTAIGMGLANSVNRLKDSEAKSKVIILLTDGYNTAGSIPPVTAAEIAKSFGIRVYTIGVGTNGMAPYPFQTAFGQTIYKDIEVNIDEKTLKEIASLTGGKYFRATDNEKLKEIYLAIDKLEKSKISVTEFRKKNEEFFPWVLAGLILIVIDFALSKTIFKSVLT